MTAWPSPSLHSTVPHLRLLHPLRVLLPWIALVPATASLAIQIPDVEIRDGAAVRGGLVDGPVEERIFKSLKGVSIAEPDPLAEFQGHRAVYHDDLHDYSTNEPTLDGTAGAILMWAAETAE